LQHKILTAAAAIAAVAVLGSGAVAASAASSPATRQAAAHTARTAIPVTAFSQEFGKTLDTTGIEFCQTSGPCNGAVTSNGTNSGPIDRVLSGFSNGGTGNYAPDTRALTGDWFALTSGAQAIGQGQGCPSTATEYCNGPYAVFGPHSHAGDDDQFPTRGFTVTNDLYLSPATAPTGGQRAGQVDNDISLNTSAGQYGRDDIITACSLPGSDGDYAISFNGGSPGACGSKAQVTQPGWYRFVWVFINAKGNVFVEERVISEATGAVVANSGRQPAMSGGVQLTTKTAGGPGYWWLPTENVVGLPLANFALQLGVHLKGNNP
jgi:hypothetical protein